MNIIYFISCYPCDLLECEPYQIFDLDLELSNLVLGILKVRAKGCSGAAHRKFIKEKWNVGLMECWDHTTCHPERSEGSHEQSIIVAY